MRQIRRHFFVAASVFFGLSAGCGRPATHTDCERIFQRIVELELRDLQTTDPAIVAKKTSELRASYGSELEGCVGKRIRKDLVTCLEQAKAASEVDGCLK
jgi:hypothetical protein